MKTAVGRRAFSKRTKKGASSTPAVQRQVKVHEVINDLFDLFDHLGIDVERPVLRANAHKKLDRVLHPLYPYASALGELLTTWHQDSAYLDDLGNPRRIKIEGRRPSLASLAKSLVPSLKLNYLVGELARLGAITITGDEAQVNMRSFPAYEDKDLAIEHTLTSLDGFIRTLRHNLDSAPSNSDQLFHRIAQRSDFDIREIPALKIRAKRHGQAFLESFDNWLIRKSAAKTAKSVGRYKKTKVSIGVYVSLAEPK